MSFIFTYDNGSRLICPAPGQIATRLIDASTDTAELRVAYGFDDIGGPEGFRELNPPKKGGTLSAYQRGPGEHRADHNAVVQLVTARLAKARSVGIVPYYEPNFAHGFPIDAMMSKAGDLMIVALPDHLFSIRTAPCASALLSWVLRTNPNIKKDTDVNPDSYINGDMMVILDFLLTAPKPR